MNTVVVTGAAGYIGGQISLQLNDAGYKVIGIDTKDVPAQLKTCFFRYFAQDFASELGLGDIVWTNPDAIIHCAGTSLVGPSIANPREYYNTNVVKTIQLLDTLLKHDLKPRIIFSSSAATYGEPIMTPCHEVDPCVPVSPYGESKLMVEFVLNSYARAYGLPSVAFRYFNACGADSKGRHGQEPSATHIIPRVLESIRDAREFTLYGTQYPTDDGTCVRDYVHVEDIAAAHILALDPKVESGVYNLGTKEGSSNQQIIDLAQKITSDKLNVVVGKQREGDPAVLTANADKFTRATGWKPKHDISAMIQHAWEWHVRQNKTI